MKTKNFAFIVATLLLLSLVSVSALISDPSKGADFTKSANQSYFIIHANNNVNITVLASDIKISDGESPAHYITLSMPSIVNKPMLAGEDLRVNVTPNIDPNFEFALKSYDFPAISITATDANDASITETKSTTFTFTKGYCEYSEVGSDLRITRIKDNNLDNTDDWEWSLLDDIEIAVKVENNGNDDIDGTLEYALYDSNSNSFVDLDQDEIDFSVDEDKSKEILINFQLPPSELDFDSSSKTYKLYVKVYEEDSEEDQCADREYGSDAYKTITIEKESKDVALGDINIVSTALCGDTVEVKATAYNIGRNDEDKVKVTLYNKELGLNLNQEFSSLDVGESKSLEFSFKIPENATEKTYTLQMSTLFDYDDDDEIYDKSSETSFNKDIKVSGNCVKVVKSSADLSLDLQTPDTEIKSGKEVTVKATIKNTGDQKTTYTLGVSDNDDFSSVQSITPATVTLEPGKSQDALITLKLNSDASGENTFKVKLYFDTKTIEQPASLTVTKSGFDLGFLSNITSNWLIWVIVLINVVLIGAIIIVAIKISRK